MNGHDHFEAFAAALDRHGAVLARWPPAQADAARVLLQHSAAARALLQQQQQLEQLLDANAAALPQPSTELRSAILAARPPAVGTRRSALAELWALLGGLRIAGPAFATALLLGLSLGTLAPAADDDELQDEELVVLAQLDGEYLEY